MEHRPYRKILGRLPYFAIRTRPDIGTVVSMLAKYQEWCTASLADDAKSYLVLRRY